MQRGFQFFARSEVMALKHILDTTVEPLDHAVGLRRSGRRQAVFDVQFSAESIELMLPRFCNYSPPILRVCVSGEGLVYGHPG